MNFMILVFVSVVLCFSLGHEFDESGESGGAEAIEDFSVAYDHLRRLVPKALPA